MIRRILITALALCVVWADPAQAATVAAVIVSAVKAVTATVLGSVLGRVAVGLALNAVSRAIQKRQLKKRQQAASFLVDTPTGSRVQNTLTGGTNPDGMILGTFATAGSLAAPDGMHGERNKYNSQAIVLSGVPSVALEQILVNGSPVTLGADDAIIEGQNFGKPATGRYAGHLWVKFYDGSQTEADPMLVARCAADPDFPWSDQMVGLGLTYMICTYLDNREIWQGRPEFKAVVRGARFYDMRKDGTNGGVGGHRLDDPETWQHTHNPVVMAAHIALGYVLPSGEVYGGGYALADIPLADAAAAMNACDVAVDNGAGGTEPAYRAGYEMLFTDEPVDVINALLQVCDGEPVDVGGQLFFKVGPPDLPVAFITDDDIIVSEPESLDPFPGLQETINTMLITHPSPASGWQATEAPLITDAALQAADGGRQLMQSIDLEACPYPLQAQRLGQAWLKDARRFARHGLHLPGDLAHVRPMQVISWTSAANGYTAKKFEVSDQVVDLFSYQNQRTLREVDPADYTPEEYLGIDPPAPVVTEPQPLELTNANVVKVSLSDGTTARRPALRATWAAFPGAQVEIEVTRAGDLVLERIVSSTRGRAVLSEGILPLTEYQVRLRIVPETIPTEWAGPFTVTTDDIRFVREDFGEGSIRTAAVAENAITSSGVAGSAAVTQNSGDWTTVCSFTIPNLPGQGFLQGTLSFRLSTGASAASYPSTAEWRVTVNGVVRALIPRGTMSDRLHPFFFGPFTDLQVGPGNVTVMFQMRNQGGLGVNNSNLFAQVAMR